MVKVIKTTLATRIKKPNIAGVSMSIKIKPIAITKTW